MEKKVRLAQVARELKVGITHITDFLDKKGVKDMKVSLADQTVMLKYDSAKTSAEKLKAAIEKLGYKVNE